MKLLHMYPAGVRMYSLLPEDANFTNFAKNEKKNTMPPALLSNYIKVCDHQKYSDEI